MPDIIAKLVEKYEPGSEDFEISIDNEFSIRFRQVKDYSEWLDINRRATEFAEDCKRKRVPDGIKPFLPIDSEAATAASILSQCCIEDQLGLGAWLNLSKKAGLLFGAILRFFQAKQCMGSVEKTAQEIEESKNDSSETDSTEPS